MISVEKNNETKFLYFKFTIQHNLKNEFEKFILEEESFETYKIKGLSYLYMSSFYDNVWFFKTIIKLKPNTLLEKYKNGNILLFCLRRGFENISNFLIESYPDLLHEKINDYTLLHISILRNHTQMYFRICDMFDFSYIVAEKTYFDFAISLTKINQEIINSIYDKSKEINYVSRSGTTLLMDCAKRGIYINNPKDNDIENIYTRNTEGENILFALAKGGINKIWDFVDINCLVNCINFKGESLLHVAAQNSSLDFFIMIYMSCLNVIKHTIDNDGWNILSVSLANINCQISNFLIMKGHRKQNINELRSLKDFNYDAVNFVFDCFEYDENFSELEILPIVEKCENNQNQSIGTKRKRLAEK